MSESKLMGGTLYHGTYLDFVKWQQEKDPNWKPFWTGSQVEFANELIFFIENIHGLKEGMIELGDKRKVLLEIYKYYKNVKK